MIGHDGYTVSKNFKWPNLKYWGASELTAKPEKGTSKEVILSIFKNEKFYHLYLKKLKIFSARKFIESF
jgi:hypothetical protein